MLLTIHNSQYVLPADCTITSSGKSVIIDDVTIYSFTYRKIVSRRLVILFDKARTARWFAEILRDGVKANRGGIHISKTSKWDHNYPFGYQYIYY